MKCVEAVIISGEALLRAQVFGEPFLQPRMRPRRVRRPASIHEVMHHKPRPHRSAEVIGVAARLILHAEAESGQIVRKPGHMGQLPLRVEAVRALHIAGPERNAVTQRLEFKPPPAGGAVVDHQLRKLLSQRPPEPPEPGNVTNLVRAAAVRSVILAPRAER